MQFAEHDVVKLITGSDDCPMPVGSVGTIIHVFSSPAEAYLVEFSDDDGREIASCTVQPEQVERIWTQPHSWSLKASRPCPPPPHLSRPT